MSFLRTRFVLVYKKKNSDLQGLPSFLFLLQTSVQKMTEWTLVFHGSFFPIPRNLIFFVSRDRKILVFFVAGTKHVYLELSSGRHNCRINCDAYQRVLRYFR